MGTRNAIGYKTKYGTVKVSYCQWDGYPEGKGSLMIDYIKNTSDEDIEKMAESVVLVDQCGCPTESLKELCVKAGYIEPEKADEKLDWYWALHAIQDNGLQALSLTAPFMTNDDWFLKCGDCEYAYIVNVKDKTLEFYNGWQRIPQNPDDKKDDMGFYPVKMLIAYPYDEIRARKEEDLIQEMNYLVNKDEKETEEYLSKKKAVNV